MADLTRPITLNITLLPTQAVTGTWKRSSAPVLVLSASTIPEDAALTTVIGTLSVSNLGILTVSSYAITADPDAVFDLASDDLIVDGALDYETATSHSVTIRATLSDASTVDGTFNITVTDVEPELEALTLAWSTAASDNTPGFDVSGESLDLAPVGAKLELWISTDVGFTPPPEEILLEAVSGNPTTLTVVDALADGAKWAKVRLVTSADVPLTDWSNVETETIATSSSVAAQFLLMRAA